MEIGDRIKALRESLGYTQLKLSKLTNLDSATISTYETNARKPGRMPLYALAKALNTNTRYLIYGVEAKEISQVSDMSEEVYVLMKVISETEQENVLSYVKYLADKNRGQANEHRK